MSNETKDLSRYRTYQLPLVERYCSREMVYIFSPEVKFKLWRLLWVALAKAEHKLGCTQVKPEHIEAMMEYIHDIDYALAEEIERDIRHDVMAHIRAYGQQANVAQGIIHLGATSCYVTDNADLILLDRAIGFIRGKLLGTIKLLAEFAEKYHDLPTLGYTHFQQAAPVTVGKRAALWLQDFAAALEQLDYVRSCIKLLGCRGATGTSDTFMELFHDDDEKCVELEKLIIELLDWDTIREMTSTQYETNVKIEKVFPVSGQTYRRGLDTQVMNALSAISEAASKMTQDIRLLQHDYELQEPFGKNQVGSSAMAYKQNPMKCERTNSLARVGGVMPLISWITSATQYLERSLDDSAGRRIYIPLGFMIAEANLRLVSNITNGLRVNEGPIRAHLDSFVAFVATERLIMKASDEVGRQEMHEKIRQHSWAVKGEMIERGLSGSEVKELLVERIADDATIPLTREEILAAMDANKLVGRCSQQTLSYLNTEIYPLLEKEAQNIVVDTRVSV